jgi:hypothetical protein
MSQPNSTIGFLRSHFESELDDDLVQAIESGFTWERLCRFNEAYRAWHATYDFRMPKPDGQLRPYIPTDRMTRIPGLSELFGNPWIYSLQPEFGSDADIVDAIQTLQHLLLYCHGVAIDWRVVMDTDWFTRGRREERRDEDRLRVARQMRFLSRVAPLLDANVLMLVEQNERLHNKSFRLLEFPDFDAEVRFARSLDWSDARAFSADSESAVFVGLNYVQDCIGLGLTADEICGDGGEAFDLYLPVQAADSVLQEMLISKAKLTGIGMQRTMLNNVRLQQLVSINVPMLDRLTVADIVAIRSGKQFGEFRDAVSKFLVEVEKLPAGLSDARINELREATFRPHAQNLKTEMERGRKPLLRSLQHFGVNGVSATAGVAIGAALTGGAVLIPAATGAAGALVPEVVRLLQAWLNRSQTRAEASLYRHMVMMAG